MTKAVLVRPDGHCNPSGIQLIESMAAGGKTQASIASALGVSRKKFEKMLERAHGENAERMAWERGHAIIEQRLMDSMMSSAMGMLIEEDVLDDEGKPVTDPETGEVQKRSVRYQSKAGGIHAIFLAKSQFGWQDKPTGALVVDNRINMTLPLPLAREELFKQLGITAPADFRKIKDVTPKPEALPAPAKQEDSK